MRHKLLPRLACGAALLVVALSACAPREEAAQNCDVSDPAVAAVAQKCGELGLVVLFDSYKPWDPGEVGKLLLLSIQQAKTRFVLAHMGFSGFRDTVSFAVVGKLGLGGNVWFDISAIATTYVDSPLEAELVWTLRKLGIKQVLFGSDWPVDTPAVAANAVRRLGLTPENRSVCCTTTQLNCSGCSR